MEASLVSPERMKEGPFSEEEWLLSIWPSQNQAFSWPAHSTFWSLCEYCHIFPSWFPSVYTIPTCTLCNGWSNKLLHLSLTISWLYIGLLLGLFPYEQGLNASPSIFYLLQHVQYTTSPLHSLPSKPVPYQQSWTHHLPFDTYSGQSTPFLLLVSLSFPTSYWLPHHPFPLPVGC
jgi:hypothetical protein